jgi:hypothetical protein
MGGGGGVTGGVDLQAKAAIPKAKAIGDLPRVLSLRACSSRKPRPIRVCPTELRAFLLRLSIPMCFASVN